MTKHIRTMALTFCTTVMLCGSGIAQESTPAPAAEDIEKPAQMGAPRWEGSLNSGFVAGSTAKFQGARLANSDAFNLRLEAGTRIDLNDRWLLRLGLASENFWLEQASGAPIPGQIHTLRFNTALSYRWDEKWTFTGLIGPSLYRFQNVGSGDFGFSGGVMASYQANPSLRWSFGIMATPDGDIPVLPIAGVRWLINDRYTLELGVPKTRLSYRLDSKWSVYGGADFHGTTFRTSDDLGTRTGLTQYNHALATYRDIRLGVGTSYEIIQGLRVELEAGYSIYRRIDYTRIDEQVEFNPAPYVRLGLSVRF
jgi:hypothetical protein